MSIPESVNEILRAVGILKCITEGRNQSSIIANCLKLFWLHIFFRIPSATRIIQTPFHINSQEVHLGRATINTGDAVRTVNQTCNFNP